MFQAKANPFSGPAQDMTHAGCIDANMLVLWLRYFLSGPQKYNDSCYKQGDPYPCRAGSMSWMPAVIARQKAGIGCEIKDSESDKADSSGQCGVSQDCEIRPGGHCGFAVLQNRRN